MFYPRRSILFLSFWHNWGGFLSVLRILPELSNTFVIDTRLPADLSVLFSLFFLQNGLFHYKYSHSLGVLLKYTSCDIFQFCSILLLFLIRSVVLFCYGTWSAYSGIFLLLFSHWVFQQLSGSIFFSSHGQRILIFLSIWLWHWQNPLQCNILF